MRKIKSKYLTYSCLLLCFCVLLSSVSIINIYSNHIETSKTKSIETTLNSTKTVTQEVVETFFNTISLDLQKISKQIDPSLSIEEQELSTFTKDCSDYLLKGTIQTYYSTSKKLLLETLPSSDEYRKVVNATLKGNNMSFQRQDDLTYNIYFTTPITMNNETVGIVSCMFPSKEFYKIVNTQLLSNHTMSYFFDKNSLNFITPTNQNNDVYSMLIEQSSITSDDINNLISTIQNNLQGTISLTLNSIDYFGQYFPIKNTDLYILSLYPKSDLLSDVDYITSTSTNLYMGLIILISILVLVILFTHNIIIYRLKVYKERLDFEEQRYHSIFNFTSSVLWEYDILTDTLTKSDADLGIYTGLAIVENFKTTLVENKTIYEEDVPIFRQFLSDLENENQHIITNLRAKDISGEYKWFELSGIPVRDNSGKTIKAIGQTVNIDKEHQELELLKTNIKQDVLTKLMNKKTAQQKINEILHSNSANHHAMFLLDLDNFKEINQMYGYVFGDALLIEISSKLSKEFQSNNAIISRIGGDEFLLFISNISSIEEIKKIAETIISLLNNSLTKDKQHTPISSCIGITLFPNHGKDFHNLLNNADRALFQAKKRGINNYIIFNDKTMLYPSYVSNIEKKDETNSVKINDRTIIDSSLISNAVDILFDARELSSSIHMILSLMGNYYNLFYIGIIEYSESNAQGYLSYEWSLDNQIKTNKYNNITKNNIEKVSQLNESRNGLFYSNKSKEINQVLNYMFEPLQQYNLTGLLECGIYENGAMHGYITFSQKDLNRDWAQHEIDSMALISKIISGYLIKLRTQEEAQRIQCTDPLTNSYNLSTFTENAHKIITEHPDNTYILFYADIDKFKFINDTYGYSEGDRILLEFANVLKSICHSDETFGRINADKFIGLFNYNNPKEFLNRIKILNKKMNEIPKPNNGFYKIAIIIGLYPISDYSNMSINIDRANIARKSITVRHKSRYAFFNEEMNNHLKVQREIEDLMEQGLANEEFAIYYQPKFNLKTNSICGAEALVRWHHPQKGLISPGDFIPIFEENHFIIKLDYYIFEQVCKHIRLLMDNDQKVYPVSVNLSRVHLSNNSIITKLQSIVTKYNVPPNLLEIELTESALSNDDNYMYTIMFKLHKMGFKLSMDDFGSGLSSLNLLRKLPFDILKLDKDFFQEGSSTERERIVIGNIVNMAKELHMSVISEGVETKEQADFLRSIHCDIAQGYFYSKPLPADTYFSKYYNL